MTKLDWVGRVAVFIASAVTLIYLGHLLGKITPWEMYDYQFVAGWMLALIYERLIVEPRRQPTPPKSSNKDTAPYAYRGEE